MKMLDWSTVHKFLVIAIRPWLWGIRPLKETDFDADPLLEFAKWYNTAKKRFWLEFPDAMCLSTIDAEGYPDGRMVLLKDFDKKGFVFFSNYNSAKGEALERCPKAALTFYWEGLQRQVRVQGTVEKISAAESDAYFVTRFRLSQIGAWASEQSMPIPSRKALEDRVAMIEKKFYGQDVPRPPHWGGYRLSPVRMEFWKLRYNRLHDRFRYSRREDGLWSFTRLCP